MRKDFIKKIIEIQSKLKAPKNQKNSFGNYKYRSCEDILEGLKPLLSEQGLFLYFKEDIVSKASRYYIVSTAILTDGENEISNCSMVREDENKKGMDGGQLSGACTSYARKYALNGLFLIDDSKLAAVGDCDSYDRYNNAKEKQSVQNNNNTNDYLQQKPLSVPQKNNTDKTTPEDWSDNDKERALEIHSFLNKLCQQDINRYKETLMEMTSFKGKDGKVVAGRNDLKQLSSKRIKFLYDVKLKEMMDKDREPEEMNQEMKDEIGTIPF